MFDAAMKVLNLLNDRHRAATGLIGWRGIQPKALPRWARPDKQSKYMPHQGKQEIARAPHDTAKAWHFSGRFSRSLQETRRRLVERWLEWI